MECPINAWWTEVACNVQPEPTDGKGRKGDYFGVREWHRARAARPVLDTQILLWQRLREQDVLVS